MNVNGFRVVTGDIILLPEIEIKWFRTTKYIFELAVATLNWFTFDSTNLLSLEFE